MNRIFKRAAFLVFLPAYFISCFLWSSLVCAVVFTLAVPIFVLFGKEFLTNFSIDCFELVVRFSEWGNEAGEKLLK